MILISIALVFYGSLKSFCIFDEIHTSKKEGSKLKYIVTVNHNHVSSKGGLINYFTNK